jgi:hypothetical protein
MDCCLQMLRWARSFWNADPGQRITASNIKREHRTRLGFYEDDPVLY